jgi:hypothetical protein
MEKCPLVDPTKWSRYRVLSKRMEGMLEGFQHRCARQNDEAVHNNSDPENEGRMDYTTVAATLAAAGLMPLMT